MRTENTESKPLSYWVIVLIGLGLVAFMVVGAVLSWRDRDFLSFIAFVLVATVIILELFEPKWYVRTRGWYQRKRGH